VIQSIPTWDRYRPGKCVVVESQAFAKLPPVCITAKPLWIDRHKRSNHCAAEPPEDYVALPRLLRAHWSCPMIVSILRRERGYRPKLRISVTVSVSSLFVWFICVFSGLYPLFVRDRRRPCWPPWVCASFEPLLSLDPVLKKFVSEGQKVEADHNR
jgi:hypothetical protein